MISADLGRQLEAFVSDLVDTGLSHDACRLFSPDAFALPDAPTIAPMNADDAIRLVRLHERRRAGRG
jgi:hypothetical protein